MEVVTWIAQRILELHGEFHQALSGGLRGVDADGIALLPIAGVAFCLGMIHALTPGHGKAILFTYFLGRRARPWAGLAAAAQIAGTHIGTAALLVLGFGGVTSIMGRPAGAAAALQATSAAAVTAAGCWYLWRALHPHPPARAVDGHRHTGVALAAGLLPCPLTMMILSAAFGHGRLTIGLTLVALMGLGIMVTIAIVGTSGIVFQRGIAARLGSRLGRHRAVLGVLEVFSALVILGIGLYSLAVWAVAWT